MCVCACMRMCVLKSASKNDDRTRVASLCCLQVMRGGSIPPGVCCYDVYDVMLFRLLCCLQVMRGEHTTRTRVLTAVLLLGGRSEGREIVVSGVCPCFIKKGNKK